MLHTLFRPELNESWTNINGSLLMLGSDIAIISNLSSLENCNPDPYRPECPAEKTRNLVCLSFRDFNTFMSMLNL